jgi:hypothetical protein
MPRTPSLALALATTALLGACASGPDMMKPMFDQTALPAPVQVPAGHKVAWETVGVGQITYECRAKAGASGQFEWVFVGPDAKLMDRSGKQVGKYYGPPATWEGMDGVKLTATQVAVAPAGAGNIPLQLVKANPAWATAWSAARPTSSAWPPGVAWHRPCPARAGNTGAADRAVPGRLHLLESGLNKPGQLYKFVTHRAGTNRAPAGSDKLQPDSSRVKSGAVVCSGRARNWETRRLFAACGFFFWGCVSVAVPVIRPLAVGHWCHAMAARHHIHHLGLAMVVAVVAPVPMAVAGLDVNHRRRLHHHHRPLLNDHRRVLHHHARGTAHLHRDAGRRLHTHGPIHITGMGGHSRQGRQQRTCGTGDGEGLTKQHEGSPLQHPAA